MSHIEKTQWRWVAPRERLVEFVLSAFVGFALLFGTSSSVRGSCWSSNPGGARSCHSFTNASGLELELCEDQSGDCERAGYHLLADGSDVSEELKQHRTRHKRTSADAKEAKAETWREVSKADTDAATGFLLIILFIGGLAVLAAFVGSLFGLDAGTSVLAVFAGFFFGLLGGRRPRRRW